jgi:hypothetical protein
LNYFRLKVLRSLKPKPNSTQPFAMQILCQHTLLVGDDSRQDPESSAFMKDEFR